MVNVNTHHCLIRMVKLIDDVAEKIVLEAMTGCLNNWSPKATILSVDLRR